MFQTGKILTLPLFSPHKSREVNSSLYAFTKELTLSYVPKKSKAILMLSSMHNSANDKQNGEPAMISDYNISKSGVESLAGNAFTICLAKKQHVDPWQCSVLW